MSNVLHFVKAFPALTFSITAMLVMLPVVIEIVQFVLHIKGAH